MLVNNLIGLWLIPFSLKYLTREEFSLYYIATDLMLWLGLVNVGTSSVFVTRVAQVLGKGGDASKNEIVALINTAFFVQCFFAILVCILGVIASFFLPFLLNIPQYTNEFQVTFLVLSLSVGCTLVGQVFSGLLVAGKQIHIDNLIQLLLIIPRIGLTVILLQAGYGILALALVGLFVSVLGILVPYFRVMRRLPHLRFTFHFFERRLIHDFFGNGVWFSIGGIAGILILNMDRFVIGNFVGLALVSNFIITQKLYSIANKVVSQVVNVSRPYLASLFGRGEVEILQNTYFALLTLTILLSSLMGVSIYVVNKCFISIWVGDQFYAGDDVNIFLVLNFILQVSVLPNRVLLASTLYKTKFHALLRLAEGLVNVILSIILSKNYGIAGVVAGSVVSTIIFSNFFLNYLVRNFFKLNNLIVKPTLYIPYLSVLAPLNFFLLFRYNFIVDLILFVILITILIIMFYYLKSKKHPYNILYDRFIKKIL